MILKRQEKGDIIKALYDSSSVLASTFNTATLELEIIFETGNRYQFQGVSKSDHFRLETASSQGKAFNSYIKRYPSTKLEPIDPSTLIDEAVTLHSIEKIEEFNGKRIRIAEAFVALGHIPLIEPNSNDYQSQVSHYVSELEKFRLKIDEFIKLYK